MISMKDYAKSKNVSYEAIRKQVARYKNELEGHIYKQDRTNFLDEYAVDFLDQKRASNPVIIYEVSKDEEIAKLREENESYLKKIASLQEKLLQQKEQMIALETDKKVAEKEKKLAISEAVSEANKKAALEKSEAIDTAKKDTAAKKELEFEPIRKELDAARQELERPISFFEWFKTKGRKS